MWIMTEYIYLCMHWPRNCNLSTTIKIKRKNYKESLRHVVGFPLIFYWFSFLQRTGNQAIYNYPGFSLTCTFFSDFSLVGPEFGRSWQKRIPPSLLPTNGRCNEHFQFVLLITVPLYFIFFFQISLIFLPASSLHLCEISSYLACFWYCTSRRYLF